MKWLFAIGLCAASAVMGASTSFVGGMVSVSGTNTSAGLATVTTRPINGTFYVQHGALPSTNALQVMVQHCADNTNFVTVATWWATTTNAATESFTPATATVTNYIRVQVVTTNSVSVATSYVN
jgi:hypothetical protein